MPFALLVLSAFVAAIAVVSLRYQLRNWTRLKTETLASDDRRYLRGMFQRRTLNAGLMLLLAGLLAGSYFTGGMEELRRINNLDQQDPPAKPTEEDREIVKSLAIYWIIVLTVLFFVLVVAIADYAATGLYGRLQYRRIQTEQRALLERDLAVFRQQKLNDRMKKLG